MGAEGGRGSPEAFGRERKKKKVGPWQLSAVKSQKWGVEKGG